MLWTQDMSPCLPGVPRSKVGRSDMWAVNFTAHTLCQGLMAHSQLPLVPCFRDLHHSILIPYKPHRCYLSGWSRA